MPRRLPEREPQRKERRFKQHSRPFRPARILRRAPVKEGEEHEVIIDAIGSRGDGIAKVHGFTVFVTGAKINEKLKIKIVSVGGSFVRAKIAS